MVKWEKIDQTRLPLSHERIPTPEPANILREGSFIKEGKDALHENVTVAKVMVEFVRSLLGPRRMSKLILAQDGKYTLTFVTTDLKTILKRVGLEHPVAQLMAGAAYSVSKTKGDGAVSTIILGGKILEKCEELVNAGVHPATLREGLILAYKKVLEISDKLSFGLSLSIPEIIRLQIHNALTGKLSYYDREHLSKLVSEAAAIVDIKNVHVSEGADVIGVKYIKGKSLADSFLVDGLALYRELPNMYMPRRIENARIALIRGGLIVPKRKMFRYYEHKFEMAPEKFREFKNDEFKFLKSMVDKVLQTGANVIMIEKGVDARIADYVARQNVMLVRRFPPPEVDRVVKATGAFAVASFNDLNSSHLGWAKLVEHKKIEDEPWLFIWGCRNPKTVDIVLRGVSEYLLQDVERIVKSAVLSSITLTKEPSVVFGGGAFEEEIALRLKKYAREIPDKRQVVVEAVAEAFESIPLQLAANAGMNEVDAVIQLRAEHTMGKVSAGVDVMNSRVADMNELEVYDSLAVKRAVVEAAFSMALTVIQVDKYVKCKQLPEPEKYYAQRIEKTKGMKIEEEV
jgi:chaperonin GroEL (HSP60 family)